MAGFHGKMLVAMALKGLEKDTKQFLQKGESNSTGQIDDHFNRQLDLNNNANDNLMNANDSAMELNLCQNRQIGYGEASMTFDTNVLEENDSFQDETEEAVKNIISDASISHGATALNVDINLNDSDNDFDLFDLDDDVKDPDWTPKRKRCDSDSSVGSDLSQQTTENCLQPETDEAVRHIEADFENEQSQRILDMTLDVIDHEEEVSEANNSSEGRLPVRRNKQMRMEGRRYTGVRKDAEGKSKYCVDRSERMMHPRNCTNRCDRGWGGRKCSQINEQTRSEICNRFWKNMTWSEKKVYVLSLVTRNEVSRRTTGNDESRRKFSYTYRLRKDDQVYIVCKALFLATLSLKEDTVYNWLASSESDYGIPRTTPNKKGGNNTNNNAKNSAIRYLQDIPKMPSHYCRAQTSKYYLETSLASMHDLYVHYKETIISRNEQVYGITQFTNLFHEMNLKFYKPKKDQCDLCVGFKVKTVDEDIYKEHIRKKTEAADSKAADKDKACKEGKQKVITMDLQSLLLCPKIDASCWFYKTKLCCHNFTLFDLATKEVMCYFWNETAADLGASTFASCILDYLENEDLNGIHRVILYSDGCTYQNRNITLACALLRFAVTHKIEVEQKFLERGHTYMECDSVHATIGRKTKNKNVYIPQKYVELIEESREGDKYKVKYVNHSFFKNYTNLKYYTSIRPGQGVGSPVVTDLRVLRYTTDGHIMYKFNYSDEEFCELRKQRNAPTNFDEPVPAAYTRALPLKKSKYVHLQQLKEVIPQDYHAFYDQLPHTDN